MTCVQAAAIYNSRARLLYQKLSARQLSWPSTTTGATSKYLDAVINDKGQSCKCNGIQPQRSFFLYKYTQNLAKCKLWWRIHLVSGNLTEFRGRLYLPLQNFYKIGTKKRSVVFTWLNFLDLLLSLLFVKERPIQTKWSVAYPAALLNY